MNEDVSVIITKLVKEYDDGKIVIANFQNAYNAIVPTRFNFPPTPQLTVGTSGIPHISTPKNEPEPEHPQLQEIVAKVDDYAERWIKTVQDLLSKVRQVRFKMQFDSPDQKGFFRMSIGETTRTEDRLYNTIDNLTMRHAELRQIILDIERGAEQATQPRTTNVEPATYDKKKKAIIFAGSVFGFRSNADTAPFLCSKIFDKPDGLWTLKELQEDWDALCEKPDWRRVYETITRINQRIQNKTGVGDLFIVDTKTVRLNPAYLSSHK